MANPKGNAAALAPTTFKAGESGNPGGKPVGARNRLQGKFLADLADDFDANGKAAIVKMRTEDPSSYIRAIVALMPKELEVKRPLEELSDDDIAAGIAALNRLVLGGAQGGAKPKARGKQAPELPAVH